MVFQKSKIFSKISVNRRLGTFRVMIIIHYWLSKNGVMVSYILVEISDTKNTYLLF